jgi:sarcinarray family protein
LKIYIYVLVLAFVFCLNQNALADPVENDFGIVNAWYNGQEATVKDVYLKVSEPAEITVYVQSKIDCDIYVELINPLVTMPYDIINGPSEFDELIKNRDVKSGWKENYTWIITPNGEWTNGNAPLNIFIQFSYQDEDRIEKFTIANPIILDEQYTGSNPSHTTTTSSSTNQSQSNSSPSFGIIAALLSVALVVIWKQRNI